MNCLIINQILKQKFKFWAPKFLIGAALFLTGCVTPSPDEWKPFPKLSDATSKPAQGKRGHIFPNIQFTDQNGNSRNISDYRGKVVNAGIKTHHSPEQKYTTLTV